MAAGDPAIVSLAVEGLLDRAVARRLVREVGASSGREYGLNGKAQIRQSLHGYNEAARHSPWFVLVDLDNDADCVPPFRVSWLPDPAPKMCFRVAVREVETWLMADRERLAGFLGVALSRNPDRPEELANPKRQMVDLARRSRKAAIKQDMVPREGSGRDVGPAYSSGSWRTHETGGARRLPQARPTASAAVWSG